jgi:hypothetical protein
LLDEGAVLERGEVPVDRAGDADEFGVDGGDLGHSRLDDARLLAKARRADARHKAAH